MALQGFLLETLLFGFLPSFGSYEDMILHAMPRHIVRGAMLIRKWKVIQALVKFLKEGLVPCVSLRGSFSRVVIFRL